LELQIGLAFAHCRYSGRHARRRDVPGRADPDGLGGEPRAGEIQNLIVDRQQPPRVVDHQFARGREAHTRGALVEQVGAQHLLQPLDLRAHGRLGDAERLGGLGETAQIHDRNQGPQQVGWNVGHGRLAPNGSLNAAITVGQGLQRAVISTRAVS
jgi:hypothetical protein